MATEEAKDTLLDNIDKFNNFLKRNGYGRASDGRKRLVEYVGISDQAFSALINGNTHGRAAFNRLNKIFNYVGYSGDNWIIY
ncbi:hypothetical protein WOSG25_140020 [Weissella oryzae SG25]|uniref:Uncharacterized protein n=1 Tax=Weissella oryzae (strain DSM 25784 / JCM 18191 / LMG 30913 / SG25) TaxID=1329250 RepID=A0A069CV71_WEIOS|nr:hypothetical protein [Weissella oryzae]GAK31700.1 hypothetical protein WOSG25_140020 [Weissella oryzae SG25]